MDNMEQLMAQARELQDRVTAAQEQLGRTNVKGISGAGACVVDMTCKYDVITITLRDDAIANGAAATAALVTDAIRDAKAKADQIIDRIMSDATAGMPMPE